MTDQIYKEKILVVDDIQLTHAIFKKILADGYDLQHALNGKEALDILNTEEPPDLILLDIMMPEMNGYELFDELKNDKRLSHIPVIFVTALDSEADELKGLETGAVDYIIKPIEKTTLIARVEYCLEFTRFLRYQQSQNPEVVKDYLTPEEASGILTPPPPPTRIEASGNILLVDNDPATIKTFNETLGEKHTITHLRKGSDIIEKINPSQLPDLIVIDALQSGFDGFKLIEQIREYEPTQAIPIIFMTSRRSKEDEARGFELGCVDYITKPLSTAILRARVRIHMQITQQRKEFEKLLNGFLNP